MFCNGSSGSGYAIGGGMFLMMFFCILIFLILICLAFKLMKVNSPSTYSLSNNSALIILNERYAKGEINEEEYTNKKTIISKKN